MAAVRRSAVRRNRTRRGRSPLAQGHGATEQRGGKTVQGHSPIDKNLRGATLANVGIRSAIHCSESTSESEPFDRHPLGNLWSARKSYYFVLSHSLEHLHGRVV